MNGNKTRVFATLTLIVLLFPLAILVLQSSYREFQLNEPLISAVSNGGLVRIKDLVNRGADINYPADPGGATALIITSDNGNVDCVRWLIEHGANPGIKDEDGKTALDRSTLPAIRSLLRVALQNH